MTTHSVSIFYRVLRSPNGLAQTLTEVYASQGIPEEAIRADQIQIGRVAQSGSKNAELSRVPSFRLYCEKVSNDLKEKFSHFSGTVWLGIEGQATHEHLEDLVSLVYATGDAVALVSERNRGQLEAGTHLPGQYEIHYEAPKAGGRGFTQTARVSIPMNVNRK